MRALLLVALLGLLARAQALAGDDWDVCDAGACYDTFSCNNGYCRPACTGLVVGDKCYANTFGPVYCDGQLGAGLRCNTATGNVRAATAADFWASCNDPNNCPTNSACNPVNGNDFCIPDCGVLGIGAKCYDAALGGIGATCDNTLDPGLRCTHTTGLVNGVVATLAAWQACDPLGVDTCPDFNDCTDVSGSSDNYCIPNCVILDLGAKCYDNNLGGVGLESTCAPDITTGYKGSGDWGCTVNDFNAVAYMQDFCTLNSLCDNLNPSNSVCFDPVGGLDPCPDPYKCLPLSVNSNTGAQTSPLSYCRAMATEVPNKGLWSFQCIKNAKPIGWCPGVADGFDVDTTCQPMPTPAVGPGPNNQATVGTWGNTYCTPTSQSEGDIDLFLAAVNAGGGLCTTTKKMGDGISYYQCRSSGVPFCVCPVGTTCTIGSYTVTTATGTITRNIGTWSNTYCVP